MSFPEILYPRVAAVICGFGIDFHLDRPEGVDDTHREPPTDGVTVGVPVPNTLSAVWSRVASTSRCLSCSI